ncbi:hypothetical protein bcgnr5378_07770 [Bacillus cereus]
MDLPITSKKEYMGECIKLSYVRSDSEEKRKHREYLEDNGWLYTGFKLEGDSLTMYYLKIISTSDNLL